MRYIDLSKNESALTHPVWISVTLLEVLSENLDHVPKLFDLRTIQPLRDEVLRTVTPLTNVRSPDDRRRHASIGFVQGKPV